MNLTDGRTLALPLNGFGASAQGADLTGGGSTAMPIVGAPDSYTLATGGAAVPSQGHANTIPTIIAIVVFLLVLKWATERAGSKVDVSPLGVNVYNFIAVGLMSVLFITGSKAIANKYVIPGATDLINAA